MRTTIKVSNITCSNCAKAIELHFNKLENIKAKVNVTNQSVIFNYDEKLYDEEFLYEQLQLIGYYPVKIWKQIR